MCKYAYNYFNISRGSGTRLWPLSRKNALLALTGNNTLLQETCRRLWPIVEPNNQWIITNKDLYHSVNHQVNLLKEEFHKNTFENDYISVIGELLGKNTAPAIFWAAVRCHRLYGDDVVLLVLPSDHLIMRENEFINTINAGIEKAKEGYLVTFGIKPTHPETGYGYIKTNSNDLVINKHYSVTAFVEKPNSDTDSQYF